MTMQAHKRLKIAFVGTLVLAAAVGSVMAGGPFKFTSVCDRCGAKRHSSEWKVLFTDFTVISQEKLSDTVLSRVLFTNHIVQAHAHHWLGMHGGGHGIKCAIGPGRHLWSAIASEELAGLMQRLHAHGLDDINAEILESSMNPRMSRDFMAHLLLEIPSEPTSPEDLQRWFSDQSKSFEGLSSRHKIH